ncbi:hypothetical protein PMZ80_001180 [Knufia obscura]|uniref:Uncharacterized protein n=2 Tax=Knufia TaxID=430999 RepID=A0AAN8I7Y7_9EURO|nr:hypothetical protein PMZ80_001180 [Knufia obscura]KAK5958757.1 hypothetical protein OHC33_000600 [Knufia fluminis]
MRSFPREAPKASSSKKKHGSAKDNARSSPDKLQGQELKIRGCAKVKEKAHQEDVRQDLRSPAQKRQQIPASPLSKKPISSSVPKPTPKPTTTQKKSEEEEASDLEEGEILEETQSLDLSNDEDEHEQKHTGPARHHKNRHFANPFGDVRPRPPLQRVSPNKKDGTQQKGRTYGSTAAASSPRSTQSRRQYTNSFTGDLAKSKWVSEQHVGLLY